MLTQPLAGEQSVSDRRTRVDPNGAGNEFLRPIGLLVDRTTHKTATGVLISNCHVLTNRHAVGGIRKTAPGVVAEVEEDLTNDVNGNTLEFHIGFVAHKPDELRSVVTATVVASGKGGDTDDWAILRLGRQVGRRYGAASVREVPFSAGEILIAAGYPADKLYLADGRGGLVRSLWLWRQEGALAEDRSYWTADLRVMAGQSGSPVFIWKSGEYVVVGLLRGEFPSPSSSRGTAQVVPLQNVVRRLGEAMARYPCN